MKIIQIGACKGQDHVNKLVKENNVELLVLIEPNPFHIKDLEICYKYYNSIIENFAIGLKHNSTLDFYYSKNDGPLYEVASLNIGHILKHGYDIDTIDSFKVKTINLNNYLLNNNYINIDYLFIDIEGLDAEISLDFDPSLFNIKNIQIEVLHLGDKKDEVISHYLNNGYVLKDSLDFHGFDIMFSKE
jgi:FkbM family methyltransferase